MSKKNKIKEVPKTLDEKQLIRQISDLIIESPEKSLLLFGPMDKILVVFHEIECIVEFITSYNYDKNNYIEMLGVEIEKITHTQTRAIFKHALTYYKDNKMDKRLAIS